eukprot:TRINITY_DN309_c0_g1_i4.p1 TRINITY_DN309_c0_g1~~TRINITY_DN309_c0_g1_i4.p1  ORF type:complete len:717 (-),score=274.45 TRINITY_DN309_c0_g1_i4:159-2309(-)
MKAKSMPKMPTATAAPPSLIVTHSEQPPEETLVKTEAVREEPKEERKIEAQEPTQPTNEEPAAQKHTEQISQIEEADKGNHEERLEEVKEDVKEEAVKEEVKEEAVKEEEETKEGEEEQQLSEQPDRKEEQQNDIEKKEEVTEIAVEENERGEEKQDEKEEQQSVVAAVETEETNGVLPEVSAVEKEKEKEREEEGDEDDGEEPEETMSSAEEEANVIEKVNGNDENSTPNDQNNIDHNDNTEGSTETLHPISTTSEGDSSAVVAPEKPEHEQQQQQPATTGKKKKKKRKNRKHSSAPNHVATALLSPPTSESSTTTTQPAENKHSNRTVSPSRRKLEKEKETNGKESAPKKKDKSQGSIRNKSTHHHKPINETLGDLSNATTTTIPQEKIDEKVSPRGGNKKNTDGLPMASSAPQLSSSPTKEEINDNNSNNKNNAAPKQRKWAQARQGTLERTAGGSLHLKGDEVGSKLETLDNLIKSKKKEVYKGPPKRLLEAVSSAGESLSMDQLREKIVQEIIETEKEYVEDLEIIINVFLIPLSDHTILTQEEIYSVFTNIETIHKVHKIFLQMLTRPDMRNYIGHAFLSTEGLFEPYNTYCAKYQESIDTVVELRKTRDRFDTFLRYCSCKPECKAMELTAFLIKPVQRICKYPLLLKELLKCTMPLHDDHLSLFTALDLIQKQVVNINEWKRAVEERAKEEQKKSKANKSSQIMKLFK